jgi:hypothetical protein
MFESFARARDHAPLTRTIPWIVGGLMVHVILVGAMWVRSMWHVEKLERPTDRIEVGMFAPPPPPPPPSAGTTPARERPRRHVTRVVQPVPPDAIEEPPASAVETAVDPDGDAAGVEAGVADGVVDGVVGPTEPIAQPPRSLATPPRPLGRYDKLRVQASDRESQGLAGAIEVVMDLDALGRVVRVALIHGLTRALDAEAMALARRFRFVPAHDATGIACASRATWTFHVQPMPTTTATR